VNLTIKVGKEVIVPSLVFGGGEGNERPYLDLVDLALRNLSSMRKF